MTKYKGSDLVVKTLIEAGVGSFFVFTGGAISHVIDSVAKISIEKPAYYCFQNEQAAAFAAEAYSRTNPEGKLGATLTTSGPGASNLISGIAGAWYDCVPTVFVTGQVRTHEMGIEKGRLQGGFQELDIVTMVKSVTKYAKTLCDLQTLREEILEAVSCAVSGRPGPVLIDLPMDLQYGTVSVDDLVEKVSGESDGRPVPSWKIGEGASEALSQLKDLVSKSKRPLIVVGGV